MALCTSGIVCSTAPTVAWRAAAAILALPTMRTVRGYVDPPKSDVVLYGTKLNPYVQRNRMSLAYHNVPFEFKEISLDDLYRKPRWMLDLSPFGKIPILIHKGKSIWESAVIHQYVEEVFGQGHPLRSHDAYEAAQERAWTWYCNTHLAQTMHAYLFKHDIGMGVARKHALLEALQFLEDNLKKIHAKGPFFMGDRMGMTDVMYMPFLDRFKLFEVYRGGFNIPNTHKRIHAIIEAMRDQDAYKKTRLTDEELLQGYAAFVDGKTSIQQSWEF